MAYVVACFRPFCRCMASGGKSMARLMDNLLRQLQKKVRGEEKREQNRSLILRGMG